MLTQDQLEQLKPLTEHPKYGKILSDAIEVWKEAIPKIGSWGNIDFSNENYKLIDEKCCCLISAAMIDKKVLNSSVSWDAILYFNIEYMKLWSLIRGFDNLDPDNEDIEAFEFGKQIHQIIFNSSC